MKKPARIETPEPTTRRTKKTVTADDLVFGGPMIAVGVRFPPKDIERINRRSTEDRRKSSDWIRATISAELDRLDEIEKAEKEAAKSRRGRRAVDAPASTAA